MKFIASIFLGLKKWLKTLILESLTRKVRFKKVYEKGFFPSKHVFCENFLNYASYDHECCCVRKPWSKRTFQIPRTCSSDLPKTFYSHLKFDDFIKIALFQESSTWKLDFSRVPEFKNEQLLPFVAIKIYLRVVWSPCLFLQIAKDLKKCFRKNLNCKVISKFFTP